MKFLHRLWSALVSWYWEPSLSRRIRARSWALRVREQELNQRAKCVRQREKKMAELEAHYYGVPNEIAKLHELLLRVQKRLDAVDDGYGALLGIDGDVE